MQVIIRTTYPGQAPQIVENQVTYPLATTMLSVPGAKTVRGYSLFGDSFVYVLFEDGTDLYWARSRVLEYLNQVQSRLPAAGARPRSGPTRPAWAGSTSTRWSTAAARMDLSQLRALQDWFLKYELKTVPNVAEVATVGGMVQQYQIVLDPERLRAFNITHGKVIEAVQQRQPGNRRLGARTGRGRVHGARLAAICKSLDDFRKIPLDDERRGRAGAPRRRRARAGRARRCAAASRN